MVDEVKTEQPGLRLKETAGFKPLVEFTSARQSVTADQEEYHSSSAADDFSRPSSSSSANDATAIDTAPKYTTPPTSPVTRRGPRLAARPKDTEASLLLPGIEHTEMPPSSRGAQGGNQPSVRFDDRQIRRKPVQDSPSSSPSPQRQAYPPPRTSMSRSPDSPEADDGPYIRFALDQLTRDEEVRGSRRYPTHDRWSTAPPYEEAALSMPLDPVPYSVPRPYETPRAAPPQNRKILSTRTPETPRYEPTAQTIHTPQATEQVSAYDRTLHQRSRQMSGESRYHTPPQESTTAATYRMTPVQSRNEQSRESANPPDVFVPYESEVPSLRFLPAILRPLWLGILIFLCALMLAAMIFSGAWSLLHNGLYDYTTFGGSRYFVFQYLPIICGMVLLLWVFQVQIALQRIAPFVALASENFRSRTESPLMAFQPTNFLLPKLFYFRAAQPIVGFCMIIFWLQIFTIPLLATVYNVTYYTTSQESHWRWTTVQGVVWTLVAIYFLLVLALVIMGAWLWRQRTGLKWDPRSIADVIALLDRSNITRDYEGSETFTSSRDFRSRLEMRSDRLGYWTSSRNPNEVFYAIGEEGGVTQRYSLEHGRIREKGPAEGVSGFYPDTPTTYGARADLEDGDEFDQVRSRYIPWYLSTSFVLLWIVAGILLYLAFLVVSFVNNAIIHGFSPLLPVRPTSDGFSSTNFLYSFIPAVISQIIFLCWLSVDYAFRRLQPYAAMSDPSNSGASAVDSLLLDYPARLPFSVTIAALSSRNLHVAWFSFLSLIVSCVPILAGGCFWAQWYVPEQQVRVAVDPSAYYALCVFMALFAFSLPLTLIGLRRRHLPHSCTTLAELISFLYGSQILGEREWRAPLGSKTEMTTRLLGATTRQERAMQGGRFMFGRFIGKDGRTHLGIERVGRDGNKRRWANRDSSSMLTQPPPAAGPDPRSQGTQSNRTVMGTGRKVQEGEGFPTLPLVGATVVGAGAARAGADTQGSNFDSPTTARFANTRAPAGAVMATPPRLVEPVEEQDEAKPLPTARAAPRTYDYGSKQDLLAESDKPEYVRQREGGSFASHPTSSVYPSGEATAAASATGSAGPSLPPPPPSSYYPSGPSDVNGNGNGNGNSDRRTTQTTETTVYPSGSSVYPPPLAVTRPRAASAASAAGSITPLPAVPAAAATTYPYGPAYGSMRDLSASEQAELVREREGGAFHHGRRSTTGGGSGSVGSVPASAKGTGTRPTTSTSVAASVAEVDVGPDLPSMLREAAKGKWSFDE